MKKERLTLTGQIRTEELNKKGRHHRQYNLMILSSVAYFVSWGIYARNFNVWDINPAGITHINYAFANIANGQVVLGDPWADVDKRNIGQGDSWNDPPDYLHGNLYQLFRLKQQYRWIKTGISIGGWTWSAEFSDVAATDTSRRLFATSAIQFILNYGMDFIDLDWEYPVSGGLPGNTRRPEDGDNLVLLLQEFKRQFAEYSGRRMQITMAISCGLITLGNYKLAAMDPYIDLYNMMCYDFAGPWSTNTDHQSNLFGRTADVDSVAKAVDYAISRGATPSKLVIGMPIYGRGFASTNGLTRPFMGGGPGTWEPGIYDYHELPTADCTPLWEPASNASFCYNEAGRFLISYDTPTSISYKLDWIIKRGLGGCMIWELSADAPFTSDKSLQRMISIWFGPYLDKTPNNLCYPMSSHGNINKVAGCPISLKKPLRDINYFRPEAHEPREAEIRRYERNKKQLRFPRAHYNYTSYLDGRLPGTIGLPSEGKKIVLEKMIPPASLPPFHPHNHF